MKRPPVPQPQPQPPPPSLPSSQQALSLVGGGAPTASQQGLVGVDEALSVLMAGRASASAAGATPGTAAAAGNGGPQTPDGQSLYSHLYGKEMGLMRKLSSIDDYSAVAAAAAAGHPPNAASSAALRNYQQLLQSEGVLSTLHHQQQLHNQPQQHQHGSNYNSASGQALHAKYGGANGGVTPFNGYPQAGGGLLKPCYDYGTPAAAQHHQQQMQPPNAPPNGTQIKKELSFGDLYTPPLTPSSIGSGGSSAGGSSQPSTAATTTTTPTVVSTALAFMNNLHATGYGDSSSADGNSCMRGSKQAPGATDPTAAAMLSMAAAARGSSIMNSLANGNGAGVNSKHEPNSGVDAASGDPSAGGHLHQHHHQSLGHNHQHHHHHHQQHMHNHQMQLQPHLHPHHPSLNPSASASVTSVASASTTTVNGGAPGGGSNGGGGSSNANDPDEPDKLSSPLTGTSTLTSELHDHDNDSNEDGYTIL
ncbi:homeotic protein labial-like [Anopheles bellator]|uniref:homeotic protein labial-like n=1 Tax=Anopheles bellator TaxID=139047 RepID=UPI0026487C8C|nr:homeotic protein labial-like [Anopheles bellator]